MPDDAGCGDTGAGDTGCNTTGNTVIGWTSTGENRIYYEPSAPPIDEINTVYYPHQHQFHQHRQLQRMGNHFSNRSSNITYSSLVHSSYSPHTEQFLASNDTRRVYMAMGVMAFGFGIMLLISLLFFLTKPSFPNN